MKEQNSRFCLTSTCTCRISNSKECACFRSFFCVQTLHCLAVSARPIFFLNFMPVKISVDCKMQTPCPLVSARPNRKRKEQARLPRQPRARRLAEALKSLPVKGRLTLCSADACRACRPYFLPERHSFQEESGRRKINQSAWWKGPPCCCQWA